MINKYYYNNQDDFSADSRESVNGAWMPLKSHFSFDDGLNFADDYDNFLTKKSRQRSNERKELRKEGLSSKDARKQALAKIPKDKLKDITKKVAQGVGKSILKVNLAPPRGAYLSLLALNFRGFAYKIMAIENGRDNGLKNALKKRWESLGGNYKKLIEIATKGEKKKPFFCGKKCKSKLLTIDPKAVKPSENDTDSNFLNVTGVDDAVIVAYVGLASAVTGALGGIVSKGIESKSKKAEIDSAERVANQEQENLSKAQEQEIELKQKELMMQGDPTNVILTNPNLSEEQKAIALKTIDDAQSKGTQRNATKYLLYGGIALVVLYLGSKLLKNK